MPLLMMSLLSAKVPLSEPISKQYIDWKPFAVFEKALVIIARLSTRVIGGLPLCTMA